MNLFTSFSVSSVWGVSFKFKKYVTSHDILVRKTANGRKKGMNGGGDGEAQVTFQVSLCNTFL